jgi:hypothetical protein
LRENEGRVESGLKLQHDAQRVRSLAARE